ncbi:short chain dehydrogenase [Tenacibaculum sp. XPcli2-G]|uniref:short chain dehydrogenase n=1 Tax=Tenacibaculum sp. XPcli2-G TaxID=2954503 RepID=UPI002096D03A|nr:short chain dehydrogenase [Tenacibaculum sp. XPcli2-G]MCO7184824.1 short chain dehydrogenase [Tenacibaculum sp. XPcli2-G]
MKKVIIVGATGIIGSKVQDILCKDYEIITINRTSGNYKLDMANAEAVDTTLKSIGGFDALIATSGYGKWGNIEEHSIQDFHDGLQSKLMGQINLVMLGRKYANPGATFVLSSGILAKQPMVGGLSLSVINAGVEAFVKAATVESKEFKINAVSPSFAKETMEQMGMDSTYGVPAIEFAKLYKQAIEDDKTGMIYHINQ